MHTEPGQLEFTFNKKLYRYINTVNVHIFLVNFTEIPPKNRVGNVM